MELTRRDALAALAAAGVTAGGGAVVLSSQGDSVDPIEERHLETITAAAEVVFPSEVEGVATFVDRYVGTVADQQPDHAGEMADALEYLEDYTRSWHDESFAALEPWSRDALLRDMGVGDADPDPEGTDVERVRYYVVNELLFALYASPTGGKLAGIENPPGHPGGLASYQRGPDA